MKKIMVLLMVMVGFAGCSLLKEQMPKDPLTVSLGKERGDPEIACSNILAYVKRGLLEEMELPEHYTQDEVEFAFDKKHRLRGFWRSNTGYCDVNDIKSMESFDPYQSPDEMLKERLQQEVDSGNLKSFEFAGNGSYVILTI